MEGVPAETAGFAPRTSAKSGQLDAWDPEKISRDIEAARRKQNPEEAAEKKRWGFEQYDPEQIARDVAATRQKQNPEKSLPKLGDPECEALKTRIADLERQRAAPDPINFSAGRKSILGGILDKIENWLREPPAKYRVVAEPPTPLTTDERNEETRKHLCQEIDDRNAMVRRLMIDILGPEWHRLPEDDLNRLELEMRHGGEEQYGGQTAEVQIARLKAKLADILKQRGPSFADEFEHPLLKAFARAIEDERHTISPVEYQRCQQVAHNLANGKYRNVEEAQAALERAHQPERGSEGEEGSDWLENSGFWHKW